MRVDRSSAVLALILLAAGAAYGALVSPYVVNSSLQNTGFVSSGSRVGLDQVPLVARLYLNQSTDYFFLLVRGATTNETYGIISPQSVPAGSLIYIGSYIAQWNVQPYSVHINGVQNFDRLLIANTFVQVSPSLVRTESYLTQTSIGRALLGLSTILALANPLYFITIIRLRTGRIPLWSLVGVLWVYAVQSLAAGLLGSAYGVYSSSSALAAVILLVPGAFIAARVELLIRGRLGAR